MGTLPRFFALPAPRRRLVCSAIAWLVIARAGLALRPIAVLVRAFGRPAPRKRGGYSASAAAWAVQAVGARMGIDCLPRALALHAMLNGAGFDSRLVLGVAKSASGALIGHAWIACEGVDLMRADGIARYEAFPPLPS